MSQSLASAPAYRPRRPALAFVAALAACLLGLGGTAEARSFRVNDVPNGTFFSCETCHGEPEAQTFNDFGSSVGPHLEPTGPIQDAHVIWETLCPGDADGDGKTNGEELGDPDCVWRIGMGNPGGQVTNPGISGAGSTARCNNGILDDGEECDGDELRLDDCLALSYGIGDLTCKADCTYDYSDCTKPPPGTNSDDDGGVTLDEGGCAASAGEVPGFGAIALAAATITLASKRSRRRRAR